MTAIEVEGLPRFQATMRAAAHDLADLTDAEHGTAQMLLDRADVPNATGELEDSGYVSGDVVAWSADHAMPIHQGVPSHNIEAHPWAPQTIADSTDGVTEIFADEITRILSNIKGR